MNLEKIIEKITARSSRNLLALLLGATIATSALGKNDPLRKRYDWDDDKNVDWIWTEPKGSLDHYNVYYSVDGGTFNLHGTTKVPSYTVIGEEDRTYSIKVCAVTSAGAEGPFSPEANKVKLDLTNPTTPIIGSCQETRVVDDITFTIGLIKPSSDRNFWTYQKKGGPYTIWTSSYSENESTGFEFVFTPNYPPGEYELMIRSMDKAFRTSEYTTATVTIPPRSSENPEYWGYVDIDKDGMSDFWEVQHFKSLIEPPTGDFDKDGRDNLTEYISSTNPIDPNSYFSAEISYGNEVIHISSEGVPGTMYQFYCSDDLNTWRPLGDPIFPDDYQKIEQTDIDIDIPSAVERYYRIEAIKVE